MEGKRGSECLLKPVSNIDFNPVLTCAVGSNTMTLMYDGGFLLFQQSFGISIKDTFKTWGALEFVNSFVGLIVILGLDLVM
ncbi:hypothetical protein GA842_10155 [Pediococcus parvulus]|uniref:Uncharacterized protein n=1 Tax=Pediococcus parvulus TaxID=54062 RepID=A0AAP5TCS0_9LACO|nr:hypothetical protein [Pediococcus parvulus]